MTEVQELTRQLATERERADYAWRNARTIEAARQEEMRKRDAAEAENARLRTLLRQGMRTKPTLLIGASLLTAVLAGGCTESPEPDQCLRREIFLQCMKALPAGPQATKYNDWDEVVGKCESVAYYQSLKKKTQIAAECGL